MPPAAEAGAASPPAAAPHPAPPPRFAPVAGPAAWRAADYPTPDSYAVPLTAADVAELDAALAATAAVADVAAITRAAVEPHMPTLGPKLTAVRDEAVAGRGFALLRGFPVGRYSTREAVAGYWILGLFWGAARPNNKQACGRGGGGGGPATPGAHVRSRLSSRGRPRVFGRPHARAPRCGHAGGAAWNRGAARARARAGAAGSSRLPRPAPPRRHAHTTTQGHLVGHIKVGKGGAAGSGRPRPTAPRCGARP